MITEIAELAIREHVAALFAEVLSNRHLYQSVAVEPNRIAEAVLSAQVPAEDAHRATVKFVERLATAVWRFEGKGSKGMGGDGTLLFVVPPIRTFCFHCEERLPFRPAGGDAGTGWSSCMIGRDEQVFTLPFECQGCHRAVIVFMVTRRGLKLTLTGRSTFEEVQVPAFIPKAHRKHYSNAVIAHRCGQQLAALFLLRTLIEQHMRAATGGAQRRGEELSDAYAATLPGELKSWAPSLGPEYARLSDALHAAREDADLFADALDKIEGHFEAKATFERRSHRRGPAA